MSLLKISSSNRLPVFLLLLMFFSIIAAKITGDSVRDAVFLVEFDKSYLPLMYVVIAVSMAVAVFIYKKISFNRDLILVTTCSGIVFVASLFLIQPLLVGLVIPLLYVWIDIISAITIMQFWIISGEIVDNRDAKTIFPLLGVGGSLAGIAAGFSIEPFVRVFGSEKLLFLSGIFLGISIIAVQFLRPFFIQKTNNTKQIKSSDSSEYSSSFGPYIKHIAVMIGLSAFVSSVVDYQFKMTAAATFPDKGDLVSYFGSFYMISGAATLLMQVFLTGFILRRFGILIGLLLLPIAIGFGSSGFLFSGTLFAVFLAKFSDQLFKFSTSNAVQEILWLPVASGKKQQVKPIIDGTIRSGLGGLAGLLIFVFVSLDLIPVDKLYLLSIPVLVGVVIWFWNSVRLRDGYIDALMSAIEDRRLSFEDIEHDISDPHVISTISDAMESKDEHTQLFALSLLQTLPIDPWKSQLRDLFLSGELTVKRSVLDLAWKDESVFSNNDLLKSLNVEDELTADVIVCASSRNVPDLTERIKSFISSDYLPVRIVSAVELLKSDPFNTEAEDVINASLDSSDLEVVCGTLETLKKCQFSFQSESLKIYLNHESLDVRNIALEILAIQKAPSLTEDILINLRSPRTWQNTVYALKNQGNVELESIFQGCISNGDMDNDLIDGIIRCIPVFDAPQLVNDIIDHLSSENLNRSEIISESLLMMARKSPFDSKLISKIDKKLASFAKYSYMLSYFNDLIKSESSTELILDLIEHEVKKVNSLLLKLGALRQPSIPIESYILQIQTHDTKSLSLIIETIDTAFSENNRKLILPLIDPEQDQSSIATTRYSVFKEKSSELFEEWIQIGDEWKIAIGLQYWINKKRTDLVKSYNTAQLEDRFGLFNLLNADEYRYLLDNVTHHSFAERKDNKLYSILEKTFFLKTVDLFREIPSDIIGDIAQIAEEVRCEKGQMLFKEDDFGDHMFVILSGKVDVIKSDKKIAELGKGNCLGEMALLDEEPRSADAKTTEDCVLFKIHHEGFYQLMANDPRIMQEIIRMLTNRIRGLNQRFTA